jgi:hypothetical protein
MPQSKPQPYVPNIDAIAASDAQRFCPVNEKNSVAKHQDFERRVRENLKRWEELRRADPVTHKWEVLWAYLCKTDTCEDPSSLLVAERLRFIEGVARRLLDEHGQLTALLAPHARDVCNRFNIELLP